MIVRRWFGRARNPDVVIGVKGENGQSEALRLDYKKAGHAIVFGAHGSGKTERFTIPNLRDICKRGESVVVAGCGDGLYKATASEFMANGYEVRVLNPVGGVRSDSWDMFELQRAKHAEKNSKQYMSDALALAEAIMACSGVDTHCDYDERAAITSLLEAIIIRVFTDPSYDNGPKMIPEFLRHPGGDGFFSALFDAHTLTDAQSLALEPYNAYRQFAKYTGARITSRSISAVRMLESGVICRIIGENSAGDERKLDITAPCHKKCAYFIISSSRDREIEAFCALFMAQFLRAMECETRHEVPVTLMIDDSECFGRINEFGNAFKRFDPCVVRLCTIWSSLDHLRRVYPDEFEWDHILSGCGTKIGFGFRDIETAHIFQPADGDERHLMVAPRGTVFVYTGHLNELLTMAPARSW